MQGSSTVLVQTVAPPPPRHHVSVGESIARGALALLSTQPLTWGASLLAAAVVPRLLGAQALGQYAVAISIMTLGSTAVSLGISDYLVRRIAQRGATLRYDVGVALLVQTVTACLAAVAIGLVTPFVAPSLIDATLLRIVLLGMIAAPAQGLLLATLRGREKHVHYAWINAGSAVLSTVGGVVVLLGGATVMTFAATTVLVSIAAMIVGWKLAGVRPALPRLDAAFIRRVKEFVRGGFPFLSWNLTLTIYGSIDQLLLGFLVPTSELGWYAAAYKVIGVTVFIPSLVVAPLFPALSRGAHQPDVLRRAIAQTLRITLLCAVPISAGIIVVAPAIPTLLGWPADFANAVPLMIILSLHLPIVAVDMVLAGVIMAIGGESRWVRVGLVASGFNIALNLVGIPAAERLFANGAIGASVITVLTEILMCAGALILIPKHLLERRTVLDVGRIVLGGAATVVVGMTLLPYALVLAIVGGALSYITVAVVLRILTTDDVRQLAGLMSRFTHRGRSESPGGFADGQL